MPSIRATRTLLPASIGCPDAVRAGHREPRNSACPGWFGRISEVAVPTSPASESLPTGLLSAGAKRRRLTKKAEAARTEKTRNCGASPVIPTPANSPTTTARHPRREARVRRRPGVQARRGRPRQLPRSTKPLIRTLAAGSETHAAFGRQSIPAKQPVMKPARPSSPGGGSAGNPSRLTASLRAAHRCVSVEIHPGQFSRWGLLPHAPCQRPSFGCRFAPLIVAFRSKYTRASSPGGGSFLTRLVSRAPRPHRDWPASALTWVPPPAAGSPETAWAG